MNCGQASKHGQFFSIQAMKKQKKQQERDGIRGLPIRTKVRQKIH